MRTVTCFRESKVLTEFLKNPISEGVWHLRTRLPFSAIEALHASIAARSTETSEKIPSPAQLKALYDSQPQRLIPPRVWVDALAIYLWALARQPISLKPLVEWTQRKDIMNYNPIQLYSIIEPRLSFFDSSDVLSGYAIQLKDAIVLDLVSLKEKAGEEFQRMLTSVPAFEKEAQLLILKKRHGSSYAYRGYSLITHLWLSSEESALVPEGVLAFLEPALNYYDTAQWRTSIVLSAISLEYILSEMYEELYKSPGPEVPLGELYKRVTAKKSLPDDKDTLIRRANEIRIRAVHRGTWLASERDALDALVTAIQLTIWHYQEGE